MAMLRGDEAYEEQQKFEQFEQICKEAENKTKLDCIAIYQKEVSSVTGILTDNNINTFCHIISDTCQNQAGTTTSMLKFMIFNMLYARLNYECSKVISGLRRQTQVTMFATPKEAEPTEQEMDAVKSDKKAKNLANMMYNIINSKTIEEILAVLEDATNPYSAPTKELSENRSALGKVVETICPSFMTADTNTMKVVKQCLQLAKKVQDKMQSDKAPSCGRS